MGHVSHALIAIAALHLTMCTSIDPPPNPNQDDSSVSDPNHDAGTEPDGTPAWTERPEKPDGCAPLGTNLTMPAYWTSSYPFVDAMKPSFQFISGETGGAWEDGRDLDLDEHGWVRSLQPGQVARAYIVGDESQHPRGRYTVLYEGEGTMEYSGQTENLQREEGRDSFDLTAGGLVLEITHVNPQNPLRNIRILLPGGRCGDDPFAYCEADADCGGVRCVPFEENYDSQPFHPEFLEEVRPYQTLRFMDWMHTNREVQQEDGTEEPMPTREYDEYPQREDKSWRPVPIDVMVDLANLLDADPWFNVPHEASDDLIRSLAERIEERLDPHLQVYIEYTNEAWNQIFDQHWWINAQGCMEESADPQAECDGDGDGELCEHEDWDVYGTCLGYGNRWFSRRTVHVGEVFAEVLGDDRVVRVMGVQVGGSYYYDYMLRELLPNGDPVHEHIDALATAPYFWWQDEENVSGVDDVFARTSTGQYRVLEGDPDIDDDAVLDLIRRDVEALSDPDLSHLELMAYEAGQGLFAWDGRVGEIFLQANRDPRMGEVYQEYLDQWSRLTDGALMMHFSTSTNAGWYGSWGQKEYQGQSREEAVKFDALLSYIEQTDGCGDPRQPR